MTSFQVLVSDPLPEVVVQILREAGNFEVFGPEIGRHTRSAVGVAGLPLNFAVEIEAEVMIEL